MTIDAVSLRSLRLAMLVCLFACGLGGRSAHAAENAGRAALLPDTSIPLTCGMQLKGPYSTPADLDHMKTLGIAVVRRGFAWESIEKSKGVYDFSAHDAIMQELRTRGLRVLGVLAFANKLYGPVREDEGRAAYARYAAAVAEHYRADGVMWELWNEPNTMTFWGRHGKQGNTPAYADEYVNLVKAAVPAMRAADPGCCIVAGSVSCLWKESYRWIDACFEKGILQCGIDAWSVHPYSPSLPEDYVAAYATVRDLMQKHGGDRDFPMLNSERGFPTAKAEGHAGGDPQRQREYQSWLLVRQGLVDLSCGLRLTNWYEWKNAKEGFGIYDGDQPSPAYRAYQVMIEQLRGYRFAQRVVTAGPRDFVLAFRGPGDASKLVVWTAPPSGSALDQTVAHVLDIPVEVSGALAVVSVSGEASTLAVNDGRIAPMLSGAPQYITVKPAK